MRGGVRRSVRRAMSGRRSRRVGRGRSARRASRSGRRVVRRVAGRRTMKRRSQRRKRGLVVVGGDPLATTNPNEERNEESEDGLNATPNLNAWFTDRGLTPPGSSPK